MLEYVRTAYNVLAENRVKIFVTYKDENVRNMDEAKFLKNKTGEYVSHINKDILFKFKYASSINDPSRAVIQQNNAIFDLIYTAGMHHNENYLIIKFMTIFPANVYHPESIEMGKKAFQLFIQRTYKPFYENLIHELNS